VLLKGVVQEVAAFGAFVEVEVPGSNEVVRGLVHISQISDAYIENVSDVLAVGQQVSVRLLSIQEGKVSLTMRGNSSQSSKKAAANVSNVSSSASRQSRSTRRSTARQKRHEREEEVPAFESLSSEDWLGGIVKEIRPYSAMVIVQSSGKEAKGCVHVAEMGDGFLASVDDMVHVNQEVSVRVLQVGRNLSLSMRQPSVPLNANLNQPVNGTVKNISAQGAFVRVSTPGGERLGLLPASEMEAEKILAVGEEVEAWLLSGEHALALTMRPTQAATSSQAFVTASPHMWFRGVVQEISPIGMFAMLQPPGGGKAVRGFVHVSELDEFAGKAVEVGESISVRVLESFGRLQLSMRHMPT